MSGLYTHTHTSACGSSVIQNPARTTFGEPLRNVGEAVSLWCEALMPELSIHPTGWANPLFSGPCGAMTEQRRARSKCRLRNEVPSAGPAICVGLRIYRIDPPLAASTPHASFAPGRPRRGVTPSKWQRRGNSSSSVRARGDTTSAVQRVKAKSGAPPWLRPPRLPPRSATQKSQASLTSVSLFRPP